MDRRKTCIPYRLFLQRRGTWQRQWKLFFSESRLIIKKYDEKGRVLTETEKKGSSIISTVYNTYSEDNIIKKITKTDAGTEKYLYNYTDDKLYRRALLS